MRDEIAIMQLLRRKKKKKNFFVCQMDNHLETPNKTYSMVFDLELIKKIYAELPAKVKAARKLVGKPLTMTEKILYSHLRKITGAAYTRGKDYVDFAPDRVAMQDATAQMALLQFMTWVVKKLLFHLRCIAIT